MSRSSVLALFGLAGLLTRDSMGGISKIPSHRIEQKEEIEQLSHRKMQKMKGKKSRKNRGRNRKPQDTALYAMLRR